LNDGERHCILVEMSARAALLAVIVMACGSSQGSRMYPAGSDKDDGYGDLAQKSARLLTSTETESSLFAPRQRRRTRHEGGPYGGDPYGSGIYGGNPYGGLIVPADMARSRPRPRPHPRAPRVPGYTRTEGLTGAIEGTVTWRGAPPATLDTACGAIANPSVRVGAHNTVGGVLVTIEHVDSGRVLPIYKRPASVGGLIAKRGCVLAPALQIATPLPASLAIHGDATQTRLRVTLPSGIQPFELPEAGHVLIEVQPGVTRIEAEDGSLGAAWVVAADTPYYAITDDTGRFRIDELAAGTYDVTFWRPPLAAASNGKLVYGPPVILHRSIKVDAARPARLDVSLGR
jgi:hypothetical protein